MAGKIEKELSPQDLLNLCDEAWKTPNLTLRAFQDLAAKYGVQVSLMGALTFKNTAFKKHLARIQAARELADEVDALQHGSTGNTLADAAAGILSREVIDRLVNRDEDDAPLDLVEMSLVVKRLRDSDQKFRALEHKIALDQEAIVARVLKDPEIIAEIGKIKSDTKLTAAEKGRLVSRKLFGEKPANFQPHTQPRDVE